MYQLKRLLVALDLTEMDEVLIKYTSHLASSIKAEKVYFFHIAKDFRLPDEIKQAYPDLLAPTDESLAAIMEAQISDYWESNYDCEKSIEVKEGNPTTSLLKWVDNKQIDLVVMGRKKALNGSGVMPSKIANLVHCSVMLVPEKAKFSLESLSVPLDFSKHSKLAADEALTIAEQQNSSVNFVHVFHVPSGFHKTGKTYEEVTHIMRNVADKNYKKFLKEFDIDTSLKCEMILDDDNAPADKLFKHADKVGADLIVMGSKGRTGIASIFLGSVASKLINYVTDIPLLIVKEKEENMGFLKALLNI